MDRFVSFTPLEMFTLIFSAAVHDLRHPGVNNNFLVTTSHPLAVRYNDKSVSMLPPPQRVLYDMCDAALRRFWKVFMLLLHFKS